MIVPVAHDVSCVWCWIGVNQVRELRRELGVEFDWQGYELYPEGMPFDPPAPKPSVEEDRPKTPSRVQLALAAQKLVLPKVSRPSDMRTHKALTALEHAKATGDLQGAVDALYDAYWLEGRDLDCVDAVASHVAPFADSEDGVRQAVLEDAYADKIVAFDEQAYANGVYNVPTFFIGGERYAEQPVTVVRAALTRELSTA
ncbi:MAG: DsbA family protein [Fimbriimonadaceae bacterium]